MSASNLHSIRWRVGSPQTRKSPLKCPAPCRSPLHRITAAMPAAAGPSAGGPLELNRPWMGGESEEERLAKDEEVKARKTKSAQSFAAPAC